MRATQSKDLRLRVPQVSPLRPGFSIPHQPRSHQGRVPHPSGLIETACPDLRRKRGVSYQPSTTALLSLALKTVTLSEVPTPIACHAVEAPWSRVPQVSPPRPGFSIPTNQSRRPDAHRIPHPFGHISKQPAQSPSKAWGIVRPTTALLPPSQPPGCPIRDSTWSRVGK